jgi:hypothetical protein
MVYQIISLTIIYFSFPFRVNLYLTDDQNKYLPSITICIPFDINCLIENTNNFTYNININRFSRIIPQESIKCEIDFKNKDNINEKIDCNKISNIFIKFIINNPFKCFTYFLKRELFNNSTIRDYDLNQIEFRFNKSNLLMSESCYKNVYKIQK